MCNLNLAADDAASLNSHPGDESSQASETSDTSEASFPGFRPVPRKRTFLSRPLLNSDPGWDTPSGPASVVPAPRRRRQVDQEKALSPAKETPLQLRNQEDQPVFSENKYGGTPSLKGARSVKVLNASVSALTTVSLKDGEVFRSDAGSGADVAIKERREELQDGSLGERAALRSVALQSSSIQDSDGGGDSQGRSARPDELSLPQSSAGEFPIEEQPLL